MSSHRSKIEGNRRFKFGANWLDFIKSLEKTGVQNALACLKEMLRVDNLSGMSFLDAGSGSGLSSLAARKLGATVHSFDFDPDSVACTIALKNQFCCQDDKWTVESGSLLDADYLNKLGMYDIAYCWGVAHHTGEMWKALENLTPLVANGGKLFVAIYNREDVFSQYWLFIKRYYNKYSFLRWPLLMAHFIYPFLPSLVFRIITGRLSPSRGMSLWHDLVDWVGGYPFEVASVREITEFFYQLGFRLDSIRTTNRSGCNEFVFTKGTHA